MRVPMLSSTTLGDRAVGRAGTTGWLTPLLLMLAAGLLYTINLDRLPHPDELHHAIAARGLLEHGSPAIAEGVYTRTLLHTWMVAGAYALFGDSLAVESSAAFEAEMGGRRRPVRAGRARRAGSSCRRP